jgi:guanosine-3',5'-bis(diphosphate) 3'-pyrophosphohydrolase
MMELISDAIQFAVTAHDGMRRKSGDSPYILHPLEAAVIVGTMTDDQHSIAAAVLHDTVEDADIPLREIEERFGHRVAALVRSETENKKPHLPPASTWRMRKEESLKVLEETEDTAVLMVWLGDKLANLRAIYREWKRDGDAVWQKFHQQDPAEQGWYYTAIADLTEQLKDYPAWQEYKTLTERLFKKGI